MGDALRLGVLGLGAAAAATAVAAATGAAIGSTDGSLGALGWGIVAITWVLAWKGAVDLGLALVGWWCAIARSGPYRPLPRAPVAIPADRRLLAVLLFVRHEDPEVYGRTLAETVRHLDRAGLLPATDLWLLSDSQDASFRQTEAKVRDALDQELQKAGARVFHRVRAWRGEAKYGNFVDFLERWGAGYEFALNLDADGVIDAASIHGLVCALQADPGLAIAQVCNRLRPGSTWYGRLQSVASATYGGLSACGLAALCRDGCWYWGHNAVIRIAAFRTIRLPPAARFLWSRPRPLPSHDLAEGALLLSRGWRLALYAGPDAHGEESAPPGPLEMMQRDSRWSGGDLMAAWAIGTAPGLTLAGRWVLGYALLATVASLLLWILVLLSIAKAADMPVFGILVDTPGWGATMQQHPAVGWLLLLLGVQILLPRLLGLLAAAAWDRLPPLRYLAVEVVASAAWAPVTSLHQAWFLVINAFTPVKWNPQVRAHSGIPSVRTTASGLWRALAVGGLCALLVGASEYAGQWILWLAIGCLLASPLTAILFMVPVREPPAGAGGSGRWRRIA